MKEKLSKILDILFESLAYLVINYTLSSMYTSFKIHWYAIPFLATNLYATFKYHNRILKITGSKIAAALALLICFILFAYIAATVGYIRGDFTPFESLW